MATAEKEESASDDETEGFYCEALADYYALANDELDLKAGEVYTILETSESGWWYAIDSDGIDGWVPSNYLEKLDEQAQINYKEEQAQIEEEKRLEAEKKKKEKEEKKRKKEEEERLRKEAKKNKKKKKQNTNDNTNNNNDNNNNDEKERQIGQTRDQNITYSTVDSQGNKLTVETRPNSKSYAARNTGKSDNWGKKEDTSDETTKKTHEWGWKNKNFITKEEAKKNEDKEREIEEEKRFANIEKPKLISMESPDPNKLAIFNNNKPIAQWTVDEVITYLIKHCNTSNTYQLKSAVGFLGELCKKDSNTRKYVLSKNGLNILLNVMCHCDKDVAISMSCCHSLTILCDDGASKQYTAEKAGVFYLASAIRHSFKNVRFCYTAFNCICNFTHGNMTHKKYIVEDEHNKTIINYIIEGMQRFRYEDDSDKNYHCTRVQTAACLALQNLAVDSVARKVIGKEGVSQVLDAMIAHVDEPQVVSAALGALKNLCANTDNGMAFLDDDGVTYLSTLLENPDVSVRDRIVATELMQNLAIDPKTAE